MFAQEGPRGCPQHCRGVGFTLRGQEASLGGKDYDLGTIRCVYFCVILKFNKQFAHVYTLPGWFHSVYVAAVHSAV